MSRSYKKSYAYIACCKSLKAWRSSYNRVFRHKENAAVLTDEDYTCHRSPYKFGYADVWSGPSDGKAYYITPLYFRKEFVERRFCKFKRHGHHLFHK